MILILFLAIAIGLLAQWTVKRTDARTGRMAAVNFTSFASQPNRTPMIPAGQGRRVKDLVLPISDYEHCPVADGQRTLDPLANETTLNPFGGVSSIRKVSNGGASIEHNA